MASDTKTTGRESEKFMLRFPDGMRDAIAEAAKANNRTMNAEIVARLQRSFEAVVAFEPMPEEELLEKLKRAPVPGSAEANALKRLRELKEAAEHQAVLLFLGEIEYKRLRLHESNARLDERFPTRAIKSE